MKSQNNKLVAPVGRRDILLAGAGLAVTPFLSGAASGAEPTPSTATGNDPFPTRAYGAAKASEPLGRINIQRRTLGPNDVLLDVLYCGICHSDIHQVRDEWAD